MWKSSFDTKSKRDLGREINGGQHVLNTGMLELSCLLSHGRLELDIAAGGALLGFGEIPATQARGRAELACLLVGAVQLLLPAG